MRSEVRKYKYKKEHRSGGRMRSIGAIFSDEDPVNRGVFFRMKIPSISTKFFRIRKKSKNIHTTLIKTFAREDQSQNIHTIFLTFVNPLRRVLVYISVRPKERPKNKNTFKKQEHQKSRKESDIKRRKNNDRYDEHGNQ